MKRWHFEEKKIKGQAERVVFKGKSEQKAIWETREKEF